MYERGELMELNLYALRSLAREMGVYGPTLYRKEDLINVMMEIQSGQREPSPPAKRGRPLKAVGVESKGEEPLPLSTERPDGDEEMIKNAVKRELIERILREVEAKLNEIL